MHAKVVPVEVVSLIPATWPLFEQLLQPSGGCDGCWCYNHHIPPKSPDVTGMAAKDRFRELADAGLAHGVISLVGGQPAGWCAVDRLGAIPGHDCAASDADADERWAIHCLYVDPAHRGRGLTGKLVEAAEQLAMAKGCRFVEAYPTPPDGGPLLDFSGPFKVFEARDYELVERIGTSYSRMVKPLGRDR